MLEFAEKGDDDLAIEGEENVAHDGDDTLPVALPLLQPSATGNPVEIKTPDPPFEAPAPVVQPPDASLVTPRMYASGGAGAASSKSDGFGVGATEEPVGIPPSWVSGWGKILNDITERLPPLHINERYVS